MSSKANNNQTLRRLQTAKSKASKPKQTLQQQQHRKCFVANEVSAPQLVEALTVTAGRGAVGHVLPPHDDYHALRNLSTTQQVCVCVCLCVCMCVVC